MKVLQRPGSSRITDWTARATHRVGRRGAFLAFLALLDGVYAYSLTIAQPGHPANWAWAVMWAAGGVNAASGVFMKRDRVQFALAAGLKAAWAAYQLRLWLDGNLPRGWLGATVWFAFAATILLVASWPEERKRAR